MSSPPVTSADFERALELLATEDSSRTLGELVLLLRKRFASANPAELNLAAETHLARGLAPEKLGPWASTGYFSLALLQQASRRALAHHRSSRFAGRQHVLEIGTGTGSDTAALAAVCKQVTTIDQDPTASELARRNLELQGFTNVTYLVGSAETLVPLLTTSFDALFADPARRTGTGTRLRESEEYTPPLSFVQELNIGSLRAIKLGPGLFIDSLPPGWSREFLGYGTECLEQTLWYGSEVRDSTVTLVDKSCSWSPPLAPHKPLYTENIEGFLSEGHAALNRSSHLATFFVEHDIAMLEHDIAYGISEQPPTPSPFLSSFRIIDHFPFHLKHLKQALHAVGWSSRTEFKKRNSSEDLEKVRSALKLPQHSHEAPYGVVFLFRWRGKHWVVIAERVQSLP